MRTLPGAKRRAKFLLYVILDRELFRGRDLSEAARAAGGGGADFIQYRDKVSPVEEILKNAVRIAAVLMNYSLPLIINDFLEVALTSGAAGVHLGREDTPISSARKRGGKELIIGASIRTPEAAGRAHAAGADYLGVGAFFPTTTKSDASMIGREVFAEICSTSKIPVIAIGGINHQNLAFPLSLGATGVAVASAATSSADIQAAVSLLRRSLDQF